MRVLSICTGMGLLDRAFLDAGYEVLPGCEIDPEQRELYRQLCGGEPLTHDIIDLIQLIRNSPLEVDGVIGGPPCQSHTKLKARWKPRFPDLTSDVNEVLDAVKPRWYLFENVAQINIPGGQHVKLDAMHFARPHQSRPRWFTYSENLIPPKPLYQGDVNELLAYPGVYGKLYGPKRASVLQGYPAASQLSALSVVLQRGIANAVHYRLAQAWAEVIWEGIT